MTKPRSYVTFKSSAFNMTEPRETFLHESNFGDDLVHWFGDRLSDLGWTVDEEIGQEDHGWYLTYRKPGQSYDLIVQLLSAETGLWLVWVERAAGLLPSLLGARKRELPLDAVVAVHDVLKNAPEIEDVNWYTREEFLQGDDGRKTPVGP